MGEYARELISRLKEILGDDALGIKHVGSTAIPGIKAKPIIDIALGVKTLNSILPYNDTLNGMGFVFRGSYQKEQLLYTVRDKSNPDIAKSYIYVVVFNSRERENYILFRDFLRRDNEVAKRYELLKTGLAKKYKNDRKSYTSSEQKFIEETLKNKAS